MHICSLFALMLFLQFWDADGSGKAIEKGFDFSELEFRSTGDSMAQQKVHTELLLYDNIHIVILGAL